MPLKRAQIERQLQTAEQDLAVFEAKLVEKGIAKGDLRKQPKWRQLDARRRQHKNRLQAVAAIETREAEALQRREAKSAGAAAE